MDDLSLIAATKSEFARQVARTILRIALRGAGGRAGQAARALGVDRKKLSEAAWDAGYTLEEWAAVKAEAKRLGNDSERNDGDDE